MTKYRTIWESITLVVVLDFLHNNFEMTTAFFLYLGDKISQKNPADCHLHQSSKYS